MSIPDPAKSQSLTPHLVITGAVKALDWYQKALGGEVICQTPMPDGRLMHAEIKFGNSMVMLADSFPEMGQKSPIELGGTPVVLSLLVPDCDAVWNSALAAGATVRFPLADQFWGDRYGQIVDPFGHVWGICTHKENLSPEEMDKRAKAAMAEMGDMHNCPASV
jgi:uncharacterized glyoxalase superfamily protein PhnB